MASGPANPYAVAAGDGAAGGDAGAIVGPGAGVGMGAAGGADAGDGDVSCLATGGEDTSWPSRRATMQYYNSMAVTSGNLIQLLKLVPLIIV